MTDFDTVLERLLTDPGFPAALAADPARALAGYQLSADEVDLLQSHVSFGDAGGRDVETRTSKAGLFGLLTPLHGGGGGGSGTGHGGPGIGHGGGITPVESGRALPGADDPYAHMSVGSGDPYAHVSAGDPVEAPVPHGVPPAEHAVPGAGDQLATDYHARVDANGDRHWDHYVAVRHADGSVDVYEDRNGDGRIDFIGHDRNGDGILESADYDTNFDGVTDVHMTDTNGDGWMDTRTEQHGTS